MLYFTETGWTLPDMWEVNEAVDAEYDQPTYEVKIGRLARKAQERADEMNELELWKDAIRILKREDHTWLCFWIHGLKVQIRA